MFGRITVGLLIAGLIILFNPIGEAKDKSLELWLAFDGSKPSVADDASGNGNDGAITGGKRVAGKFGKAIAIGLKDEFVEIGDVLQQKTNPAGTLMMWFKPNWKPGTGTSYRLFDANTAAIYWLIGQGKTGGQADKFGFWFEDAADKDFQDWQPPSASLKQGQWNHIATTWDFDKGEAKFFIDGAEVSKTEGLGGFPPLAPKPKIGFNVGINYMPATHGADSDIDEFAIYSEALDAKTIKTDMAESLAVEADDKLPTTWAKIKSAR